MSIVQLQDWAAIATIVGCMATIFVGLATMYTLMTHRFDRQFEELKAADADIRDELRGTRADLKADNADLRAELKADNADLRAELKADNADLRAELMADNADLRAELTSEIIKTREHSKADIASVHREMAKLESAVEKVGTDLKGDLSRLDDRLHNIEQRTYDLSSRLPAA